MRKTMTLLLILFLVKGNAQKSKIEIRPYQRIDWYPEFSYNIAGRPSVDYLTIRGISSGFNFNYKPVINDNLNLVVGAGYYCYSFNKLKNINSIFGEGNARVIDYPSTFEPIYTTDKYFYHTITLAIGVEKKLDLKNNFKLITGAEVQNYYTFSQKYHITSGDIIYKKKANRYFGISGLVTCSLLKGFQNFEIGPILLFPLADIWKKDDIFPEEKNSQSRSKWFRGIGYGISTNIMLTSKK